MTAWPADKVERRTVASLVPYARNSRTHSAEQVGQIAASIKEWGWTVPILVDEDGGIIAGHGRILAAQKLGIADVPCMVATGWTDAQRKAYIIADNKLALNAGWDDEMLGLELKDLADFDFDMSLTGFSDDELQAFAMADEDLPGEGENEGSTASLADKFGIPPFSVLNAREGWWQNRKRSWLALGIKSELGRGENLAAMGGAIERREAIKRGGVDLGDSGQRQANAAPGGSLMPAANYSKRQRGNGKGQAIG
jgi:hypothetical protein